MGLTFRAFRMRCLWPTAFFIAAIIGGVYAGNVLPLQAISLSLNKYTDFSVTLIKYIKAHI